MDLRNGNIKVRELMSNPGARDILRREFPGVFGSPMFRMAQNMSLDQVIRRVRGSVPPDKITEVIDQLKAL